MEQQSETKGKYIYTFTLSIGYGARTHEYCVTDDYDNEEWDSMEEKEREEILQDELENWAYDRINMGWS